MDSLPIEVITHILRHLPPVEVQVASEVCSSFYQASLHPSLVRDRFLGRKPRCNFARVTFKNFNKGSHSLDLTIEGHNRDRDLTWDNSNAGFDLTSDVRQLQLRVDKLISPYLTVIIIKDILSHFPHLETLILKDLNMHIGFLLDGTLSQFLLSLRTLRLCSVGNPLNFLQGPTLDLLSKEMVLCLESEVLLKREVQTGLCNDTMTLDELGIVCNKYSSIFSELRMLNPYLSSEFTEKLVHSFHKRVETLRLVKCNYVNDEALDILSNSPLRLKTLLIDGCKPNTGNTIFISTKGINTVACRMKSLVNLTFFLREKVRFDQDTFSSCFTGLTSVSLMSYGQYHEYCTINLHSGEFKAAHLYKLDSHILLTSLAHGSTSLQELTLDLICELTDSELLFICKTFPDLSVLNLNSVCHVTDRALLGCEDLESITVKDRKKCLGILGKSSSKDRELFRKHQNGGCHRSGVEVTDTVESETEGVGVELDLEGEENIQEAFQMPDVAAMDFSDSGESSSKDEVKVSSKIDHLEPVSNLSNGRATKGGNQSETVLENDLGDDVESNCSQVDGTTVSPCSPELDEYKSGNCISSSPGAIPLNRNHGNSYHRTCLGYCRTRCRSGTCNMMVGHRGLRQLQKLHMLSLVGCCEMSDEGFALGLKFSCLSHLKLTHCDNLTDSGVAAVVTNNLSLKTFVLEFCNGLSDDSVRTVSEGLKFLEKLKFDNCSTLTGECLRHVTLSTSITDVWFGSCKIPVAEVEAFQISAPRLKYHDFDW